MAILLPFGATGWRYLQVPLEDSLDRSGVNFDDSDWANGTAPFHESAPPGTLWQGNTRLWARNTLPGAISMTITIQIEDGANLYLNGQLVEAIPGAGLEAGHPLIVVEVPAEVVSGSENLLAIDAFDEVGPLAGDQTYLDVEIVGSTRHVAPALRGRQRGDSYGSSSAPRGRQTGSRQASLRGRSFL